MFGRFDLLWGLISEIISVFSIQLTWYDLMAKDICVRSIYEKPTVKA